MNEISFFNKNSQRWQEFDKMLQSNDKSNPDKISDLFIQLTDDLAYSRTYFPNTQTTLFLNQLTQKAYQRIYLNKPVDRKKFFRFWKYDFPLMILSVRKEILYSFIIFIIAIFIGVISTLSDAGFVRIILGDSYVNMTLANIEKGDPMAIYKQMNEVDMFLGITYNNIQVSFVAFILGCLTAFGTGYIMLLNGIMLGTFQCFMAQQGMFLESVATIWIHGTLEIFSIIIAGAAGIVLGNSIVFPKTFSRGKSFRLGVNKGVKIVIGLIPIFIVAGFLEGFVTRHTEMPYIIRFIIIGLSVLFIIQYFFIYPKKLTKKI